MPRGDKTGPRGLGTKTGRGLGYCSGYSSPGYTKGPGMGMAWGGGRGHGRIRGGGWGRDPNFMPHPIQYTGVVPPYPISPDRLDPEEESKYLEQTLTNLKNEIKYIENRLEELASEEKE
ncbi:MAG: DUF5320 domain-containing protein [Candidatus Heimdallarchaeota archaeon]|nr:MAG: DUF5320 domain-containing protein [Candidatus Heimdallarchaeota archaeon]